MRAVFFISMLAITFAAAVLAWHCRNGRVKAEARLQQALAVRPSPSMAFAAPIPASVPAAVSASPKAKDTSAAREALREALRFETSEARRAKNPQLGELHRKQLRMEFLLKNGAFLRSRNLAETDRERLLAAWIAHELDAQDLRILGRELRLPVTDPALMTGFEDARQRLKEVETAVLGPEGVAALAEYRQGQTIRDAVMKFQADAALAGYPLTLEQADTLAAVLVSAGVRPDRPARSLNQVNPATAERLLAGVLSPEQSQLVLPSLRGSALSGKFTTMALKLRERELIGTDKP